MLKTFVVLGVGIVATAAAGSTVPVVVPTSSEPVNIGLADSMLLADGADATMEAAPLATMVGGFTSVAAVAEPEFGDGDDGAPMTGGSEPSGGGAFTVSVSPGTSNLGSGDGLLAFNGAGLSGPPKSDGDGAILSVPLPGAGLMGLVGLACLGATRRRRL